MAHAIDNTENSRGISDRRLHSREKIGSVIYIELAAGNGGIILNISEGGLAVRAARALVDDQLSCLRFRFSHSQNWITGTGVIAWKSKSQRLAGIRFVDLSEGSRTQISGWISSGTSGSKIGHDMDTPLPSESLPSASTNDNGKSLIQKPAKSDPSGEIQSWNSIPPPNTVTALHSGEQTGAISVPTSHIENTPGDSIPENDMRSTLAAPVQAPPGFRKLDSGHSRRANGPRSLLKRYLVDERHRIRLFDLVSEEVEKLC